MPAEWAQHRVPLRAFLHVIKRTDGSAFAGLARSHLILDGKGAESSVLPVKGPVAKSTGAIHRFSNLKKIGIISLGGPGPAPGRCSYQAITLSETDFSTLAHRVAPCTGALFPPMSDFDVVVAGGGSAGLAAAVAAARTGAQTLLVEAGNALGGAAPAALVHSICGLYHISDHGPANYANAGFAREFAERLLAAGGALGPTRMGKVEVLLHNPGAFSEVAAAIARETPRLEVRLDTQVTAVTHAARKLSLESGSRRSTVAATTLVDASGDGVIAALLDAPFEQEDSERLQRPAFVFSLAGLAPDALADKRRFKIAGRIVDGVQRGDLPPGAMGAGLRQGIHPGEAFVTIDLAGPEGYNPTDAATLNSLEIEGRDLAFLLASYLQKNVDGFENSSIGSLPSRIAVRESRRIVGRYRLETEDIERGAQFDDAVALATWPIELRETNRGPRLRFSADDRPCEIPLRSLRFRDFDHLFMAGRCLSCSHGAQASIRVIGTCLATGEAAGRAAALLAADRECTAENVRALGAHSNP